MKKLSYILISALILFIITPVFAQENETALEGTNFVMEGTSQDTIISPKEQEQIHPGKLNQLVTALVTLDQVGDRLNERITIGENIVDALNYNSLGLEAGQELTYQDLLYAILLESNSDAADILSINLGTKFSGNSEAQPADLQAAFVEKMNEKVKQLGLKDTLLASPSGEDETSYSTPKDLTLISETLMSNETVRKILTTKEYTIGVKEAQAKKTVENKKQETENTEDSEVSEDIVTEDTQETEEETDPTTTNTNSNSTGSKTATINSIKLENDFLNTMSNQSPSLESETQSNATLDEEVQTAEDVMSEDEDITDQKEDSEENKTYTQTTESENQTESKQSNLTQDSSESANKVQTDTTTGNTKSTQTTNNTDIAENTVGFITTNSEGEPLITFESNVGEAKVYGTLTGASTDILIDNLDSIVKDVKNNYTFVDLTGEDGVFENIKLGNTGLFFKKRVDLKAKEPIRVFVPQKDAESVKTNLVVNQDYLNETNNGFKLIQSVDPTVELAQLKISKSGDGSSARTVPLYSSVDVKANSWFMIIIKVISFTVLIFLVLFFTWLAIFVHNRKKVIRRKRELRKKKIMAMKRKNKIEQIKARTSSPTLQRMAH